MKKFSIPDLLMFRKFLRNGDILKVTDALGGTVDSVLVKNKNGKLFYIRNDGRGGGAIDGIDYDSGTRFSIPPMIQFNSMVFCHEWKLENAWSFGK